LELDALIGGTLALRDARDFVMAQNKARRHITAAQLAMAAIAVHSWMPVGGNQHLRVDIDVLPSKPFSEPMRWSDIAPEVESWFDNIDLQGRSASVPLTLPFTQKVE
jgi:hypothetical protein